MRGQEASCRSAAAADDLTGMLKEIKTPLKIHRRSSEVFLRFRVILLNYLPGADRYDPPGNEFTA